MPQALEESGLTEAEAVSEDFERHDLRFVLPGFCNRNKYMQHMLRVEWYGRFHRLQGNSYITIANKRSYVRNVFPAPAVKSLAEVIGMTYGYPDSTVDSMNRL